MASESSISQASKSLIPKWTTYPSKFQNGNDIDIDDRSGTPVRITVKSHGHAGKGKTVTKMIAKGKKMDRNYIPNIKIYHNSEGHQITILMTASKKSTEIMIEHESPRPAISDFMMRNIAKLGYPLVLLGNSEMTKEMLEVGAAIFYLRNTIREIYAKDLNYDDTGNTINKVLDDPNVLCVIPGDGKGPRVGYFVALWTKWTVLSIDPIMEGFMGLSLPNLHCIRGKAEDVNFGDYMPQTDHLIDPMRVDPMRVDPMRVDPMRVDPMRVDPMCVLLHVHSHADFPNCWDMISSLSPNGKRIGITLPCCAHVRHTLEGIEPVIEPVADFYDPELSQITPTSRVVVYTQNFVPRSDV